MIFKPVGAAGFADPFLDRIRRAPKKPSSRPPPKIDLLTGERLLFPSMIHSVYTFLPFSIFLVSWLLLCGMNTRNEGKYLFIGMEGGEGRQSTKDRPPG